MKRLLHSWNHRPPRYQVYVDVKRVYRGRYLTLARLAAAWTWLFTTYDVTIYEDAS